MSFAAVNALLGAGGGITISAERYSFAELHALAGTAKTSGVPLIIKKASRLSFAQLNAIASAGEKRVIFDFTE